MIVIFVHGWSVRNLDTYGQLPARLRDGGREIGLELKTGNIFLGQYVSFQDGVTVEDIARAFNEALKETVLPALAKGERFACITHSTGGPVVRKWLDLFYGPDGIAECPMSHLVMLAPANHGSALAQLGKTRLSRTKFFVEGAEPGKRVLDWLELGSAGQWELNLRALDYDYVEGGLFPFVLTGQRIDRSMYDHLNSYTGEPGSDGVVRAAGANLNFNYICLEQDGEELKVRRTARTPRTAFGILPGRSHSGDKMGIIRSVGAANPHPTVTWVLRCLAVNDAAGYEQVSLDLEKLTAETQQSEKTEEVEKLIGTTTYVNDRHSMLTFRLRDDRGEPLADYDLLLTAGPGYSEDELPDGFFVDRQRNQLDPGRLTYYLDHDIMESGMNSPAIEGKMGFRVVARPNSGLAYYTVAAFESDVANVEQLLRPNETAMVEITLRRNVDLAVFRLTDQLTPAEISQARLERSLPWESDEVEERRRKYRSLMDRLDAAATPEERARIRKQIDRLLE